MSRNHLIEQEELMAYLDGELVTERAVEAAAHLERCEECREFAAELRKMSQKMMAWEVEQLEVDGAMPVEIVEALEEKRERPKVKKVKSWRVGGILITPRRLELAGGAAILFLLILAVFVPNYLRSGPGANKSARMAEERPQSQATKSYQYDSAGNVTIDGYLRSSAGKSDSAQDAFATKTQNGLIDGTGTVSRLKPPSQPSNAPWYQDRTASQDGAKNEDEELNNRNGVPEAPMIARTAGLTLVAKDFEKTRTSVEEILKRHNGYIGELSVSAPSDAGRTLTATLRIPAPQLEGALAELKQLGRVENESQGGEEVTAQYVDLAARLANAQHTEKRLTEILSSRTGKLQDVLKVELEIDRVRGEIEQMQAEKKELTTRVAFATLNTTVKEEYKAKLQGAPPSTGSRFRNAAVDGYNTVVEGLIDVGLFLLSSGPSLLIWAAILFFPVRWLWRKARAEWKKNLANKEA
ncbi:MAG TPA: DUF4349 domain-containing protein [Candidatus Angelobacter sp.]|nr:DUF4349 domain-containing protein [Candidatus Angelobacter sp.]